MLAKAPRLSHFDSSKADLGMKSSGPGRLARRQGCWHAWFGHTTIQFPLHIDPYIPAMYAHRDTQKSGFRPGTKFARFEVILSMHAAVRSEARDCSRPMRCASIENLRGAGHRLTCTRGSAVQPTHDGISLGPRRIGRPTSRAATANFHPLNRQLS
jgi:hypothetical protein